MPASSIPDPDPQPVPPLAPGDDECCGNGCDPCIFDLYGFEQDRYFKQLREWKERQALKQASADPGAPPASST